MCATLLAREGHSVLLVERREQPGGILDGVVDTVGGLHAGLADELGLAGHGLRLVRPEVRMVALREAQRPVVFWADPHRTAEGLGAISPADAWAYPGFDRHVRLLAGFMAELAEVTPPRLDKFTARDAGAGLRLARAYRRLGERGGRELTRALPMASADFVSESLTDDAVRGPLAARGTRHTAMGPWSAGTTAVLLQASSAPDAGAAGETTFAAGGPGALAAALASAATAAGVEIRTSAEVARVTVEHGRVSGVVLASGEDVQAPVVASAVDPKTVLTRWLDPVVAGPQLRWRAGNIRTPGAAARVELELSGLPAFSGVEDEALLGGRIVVAPGVDAVEQAFDAWKYGEVSLRPYLDAVIPSLAEPGADGHRMHVLAQWVPYGDGLGDLVAERVVGELERHAPGIGGLVTSTLVHTPSDLEREYGLPGGHVHHAEHGLDQLFAWRPVIGMARYRLAIPGLYLCGSGAHPGGGVSGLPGRNAAREIARDLR
ncbi:MAG: phytoene desaturase family protein [Gaiellales bacterium]